jgi:peptidoglycan/xylan/chitin deacetylase (PgdA/CDA1 family)
MRAAAVGAARSTYHALRAARGRLLNLVDRPVVILLYHRVTTLPADPQLLAVAPERFRAQLRYLKDRFPLVRLEDDWSRLRRPAVAVTFDDGYADNAKEALPILEEVGVPATFFVTTGAVGSLREFWWDDLERLVLGEGERPPRLTLDDPEHGRSWPTSSLAERRALYAELHPLVKRVDPGRREGWLGQLRAWAGAGEAGREANRALTADELRRLAASPWVTLGAHTVTHTPLSSLPAAAQREEIAASRRQLEAFAGKAAPVFSYPFGTREDYTRASRDLCEELGFVKAASNFPGQAHAWTDPFQLPRQLVRDWPVDVFAERLRSFWVR